MNPNAFRDSAAIERIASKGTVAKMLSPTHAFWRAVLGIKLRIFKRRQTDPRGVVLHDPQAAKPKDLDDPFQDADIQKRIGEFIARITARSKAN